ncbi:TetR-like C-terminal domain-containing protein [Faecalicatena contorta]|uniref:TetR-like C-terminal domain-containing protein n=1 Tax=Faecalicatena contorta TaxID=39482 RepID=UPI0015E84589|nr:TetR-like C-terminal domain-containing protein [Faecalicatena contorta]
MLEFNKNNKPDKYYAILTFFRFWERHLHFIRNMQNCGLSNYVFDQFRRFSELQQDLLIGKKKESTTTDYVLAFRIGGFWNVMLTWASNNANLSPEELATIIFQV